MARGDSSTLLVTAATAAFVAGIGFANLIGFYERRKKRRKYRDNAGATVEGRDLSLFYGDRTTLNTTPANKKFLPSDLYKRIVQDCVVCCVDCLIVRRNTLNNQMECLLVERGSEPAKGLWWLPGGRLYRGETFFDGAVRKAKEETGLEYAVAKQVLGFYNTFFPTSHWDDDKEKGTQTVQPIVLVELKAGSEVMLDSTSERFRWIGLDPDAASKDGEDRYVLEALYRLQAWDATYGK